MCASRTIKGYEVQERIMEGGMGMIHRAYQINVGREVAIKEILPKYANQPDFIRRFESEAQLVARLEHPHIVPLYDYWRDPDGAYLVMRYLRGGSLKESLHQGAFDLPTTSKIMHQISNALDAAHRNAVIHRDLKPANILLDEDGNAYLADFGIAKDHTIPADIYNTGSSEFKGTLLYLAPEQARNEPITPRTDIYSLGVVLYEILAGEHPFPNLSPIETMYKHLNDPLPMLTTLNANVMDAINQVIQQATAKNPVERYENILTFAKAFADAADLQTRDHTDSVIESLTRREHEILQMLVNDNNISNKDIAQELVIAVSTVKWYIHQLFKKLNVRNRVQLIIKARELNLIFDENVYNETRLNLAHTVMVPSDAENPYKGLRAFQAADAQDFFGRDKITRKILTRLQEKDPYQRFLAIVGPSGSGKSSLVKAGVIPSIWRGELPDSDKWFVIDMLPGDRPLDELEVALKKVAADKTSDIREQLERDTNGLLRIASLILPDDGAELLIVIDQFEEVFTLLENEDERQHFLNLIYAAVTAKRSRVRILVTLRADFFDRPLRYPQFGELMRERVETVLPLTAEELEQAIVNPVKRYGLKFEEGLVSAIIGDINYQPGALPLLQYALSELFERRAGNQLTHAAYQEIGGAVGALAKRADEIFHEFQPEQQTLAHQMFMRLVTLGEGTEDTRRRTKRPELLNLTDNPELMDEVIDTYANYRLLALDHDPATREPTVEVAHEAILREWERLRTWLNDSRADIKMQRMLATAAQSWTNNNYDNSYLLRGSRLDKFEQWVAQTELSLTPNEQEYIEKSLTERQRAESVEVERQAKESHLEQRARRVLQGLVGVFLIATIISGSLAIFALGEQSRAEDALSREEQARQEAEREADVNRSLVLADAALTELEAGNANQSLLLALEAVRIDDPPPEAINTLSTIAFSAGTRVMLQQPNSEVRGNSSSRIRGFAFAPNSRLALSSGCAVSGEDSCVKGEMILWDVLDQSELRRFEGHTHWINSVSFSSDGNTAVSASEDSTLIVWDVATGEVIQRFAGHTGPVNSVIYGPNDETLVSASDDNTIIIWNVATGSMVRRLEGHTGSVNSVSFSPDWQMLASAAEDTNVMLWNWQTGEIIGRLEAHTSSVLDVKFRPLPQNRYTLLSTGQENSLREWDLENNITLREQKFAAMTREIQITASGNYAVLLFGGFTGIFDLNKWRLEDNVTEEHTQYKGAYSVAISPDEDTIILGHNNGAIRLINMPISPETYRWDEQVTDVPFISLDVSKNGQYLVTGSYSGGVAVVWDLQTKQEMRRLDGLADAVLCAEFSPVDPYIVLCTGDYWQGSPQQSLLLWNFESGEIIYRWDAHEFYPYDAEFSPDGKVLVSGSINWALVARGEEQAGDFIIWSVETGEMLHQFDMPNWVLDTGFNEDGSRALTAVADDYLVLWDTQTWEPITHINEYVGADFASQFAVKWIGPNTVLIGAWGAVLELDIETNEVYRVFSGHEGTVVSVDLSLNRQYMVSGDLLGHFIVWDFQTGEELRRLDNVETIVDVNFSSDGNTVFFSGFDGIVRQWRLEDWSLDELLDWIDDNRYIDDLSCSIRERYRIEPVCK